MKFFILFLTVLCLTPLARAQYSVAVVADPIAVERGNAAAEKLKGLGIDARATRLDVTDRASVEAVAQLIERDFGGRLDVLVNNAGIALDRNPPSQTDLEKFKTTHETNVFGPLLVTTTMLPLLKRSAAESV